MEIKNTNDYISAVDSIRVSECFYEKTMEKIDQKSS